MELELEKALKTIRRDLAKDKDIPNSPEDLIRKHQLELIDRFIKDISELN